MANDVEQKFQRFLGLATGAQAPKDRTGAQAPNGKMGAQTTNLKAPIPPSDGRRLRMTGRVAQLNLKVKPETKRRMLEMADARGITMGALLEELLGQSAPPKSKV